MNTYPKQRKMKNRFQVINSEYAIMYVYNKVMDRTFEVKLDLSDMDKLIEFGYSWHIIHSWNTDGYYVRTTYYDGMVDGKAKLKMLYLHRYLTDAKDGEYVDHRNQDSLDNRRANFRVTTNENNLKHRKGANKNNKSGCRNVAYIKSAGTYRVQFQVNGEKIPYGDFKDLEEAIKFANEKRKELYGEYQGKYKPKE